MREKLKELLKDHVEKMRRGMRWDGENDAVIEKILELFNNEIKRTKNDQNFLSEETIYFHRINNDLLG